VAQAFSPAFPIAFLVSSLLPACRRPKGLPDDRVFYLWTIGCVQAVARGIG